MNLLVCTLLVAFLAWTKCIPAAEEARTFLLMEQTLANMAPGARCLFSTRCSTIMTYRYCRRELQACSSGCAAQNASTPVGSCRTGVCTCSA